MKQDVSNRSVYLMSQCFIKYYQSAGRGIVNTQNKKRATDKLMAEKTYSNLEPINTMFLVQHGVMSQVCWWEFLQTSILWWRHGYISFIKLPTNSSRCKVSCFITIIRARQTFSILIGRWPHCKQVPRKLKSHFSIQTAGVTAFLYLSFIFTVFRLEQGDPLWCSSSR